jgi:hypothetical protein
MQSYRLFVLVFWFFLACNNAEGSDSLIELKKSYPAITAAWDAKYRHGLTVDVAEEYDGKKGVLHKKVFFSGAKYRVEAQVRSNIKAIACFGDKWMFTLLQKEGSNQVVQLERSDQILELDTELLEAKNKCRVQYHIIGKSLLELLETPGFRIDSFGKSPSSKEELIQIEYEVPIKGSMYKESLVLEPSRDWAIRRHETTLSSGTRLVHEISYLDKGVYPHQVVVSRNGKPFSKVTLTSWKEGALPNEPFLPSYYGIPEYSNIRTVVTYAIAIVLFSAIGASVWWFARRRS